MTGTMRWLSSRRRRDGRAAPGAALMYAVAWLVGAGIAVGLVFAVFGDGDDDTVSVPPVRETELAKAAGHGRCELRAAAAGERLNPPVDGPAGGRPARPGFYDEPVASASLTAALRHGIIVIQFHRGLDGEDLEALKTLQAAAPTGTIVAAQCDGDDVRARGDGLPAAARVPALHRRGARRGPALPGTLRRGRARVLLSSSPETAGRPVWAAGACL